MPQNIKLLKLIRKYFNISTCLANKIIFDSHLCTQLLKVSTTATYNFTILSSLKSGNKKIDSNMFRELRNQIFTQRQ